MALTSVKVRHTNKLSLWFSVSNTLAAEAMGQSLSLSGWMFQLASVSEARRS